jgi:hypothetical protein
MHVMTQRQDDTSAPTRGADILPFRRPDTSPVPTPAPYSDDDSDDDGPSAA